MSGAQAGGYISVNTGSAPDANSIPVPKDRAEAAFDAAACIGCGACVAACPNASASLFIAAKAQQLSLLPQGQPERLKRAIYMVEAMDRVRVCRQALANLVHRSQATQHELRRDVRE